MGSNPTTATIWGCGSIGLEHVLVEHRVVGSSPITPANKTPFSEGVFLFYFYKYRDKILPSNNKNMNKKEQQNNNSMPLLGDKFPEMTVNTTHGEMKLPKAFKGKWFILFSHPADFTPVCTTEFIAFQNRYDQFKEMDCELIGLSIDQVFAHIKWEKWIKENMNVEIKFPIIADIGSVAETLGLVHPGKGSNTVRAVFIVDDKGVIRTILYYPQELGRNMDEILRIVKALQTADDNEVAMPANWPHNEIIGDNVILPPASNVKDAEKRIKDSKKGKYNCFDWWLCHKDLEK